ncbi:MAG: ABC transporter substrate-binding protein [Chloroflexi bacterium]|nr:ABC transporter substrate-binding protein [Chloroflexota bacterium]
MVTGSRSWPLLSCLAILGLLVSCAPAAAPAPAPTTAPRVETPVGKSGGAPAAPTPSPKPAAEQPKSGGILKHAAFKDEGTLDLHVSGRGLVADQAGLAYNGLLQFNPEDGREIITDLAESYRVSPDGKKVTFLLRKNVNWHDGKPFTSEDVKFNFDRWMTPPEGVIITRKEIVAAVERVETPDPYTVDVHLKYPSPFFVTAMALVAALMLPPQYLKDRKTMEFNVLGTGPYKLKKYTRSVGLEYVKNENYFVPGRPYLDGLVQYMVPDQSARFAAFRTGQVRTLYPSSTTMTASHAELLRKEMSDRVNVARYPGMTYGFVYLNFTRPPFNDVRVRQAVDMVLDRKRMLEVVEGRGEVMGPMIRGLWSLPDDELLKRPGYRGVTAADIQKAKALLAEAGYPNGFPVEAMIADQYTKQTVFIQSQLKAIGIDVSIKVVDVATNEKRLVAHDFAMGFYLTGQPVEEPDLLLSFYVTGGGRAYSGFSDKQIDDWYREQSRTTDAGKRKEIVLNMQRRILNLAATPVLYHQLYETAYWKCVRGYYPEKQVGGPNNSKKQNIWLDESCR